MKTEKVALGWFRYKGDLYNLSRYSRISVSLKDKAIFLCGIGDDDTHRLIYATEALAKDEFERICEAVNAFPFR